MELLYSLISYLHPPPSIIDWPLPLQQDQIELLTIYLTIYLNLTLSSYYCCLDLNYLNLLKPPTCCLKSFSSLLIAIIYFWVGLVYYCLLIHDHYFQTLLFIPT